MKQALQVIITQERTESPVSVSEISQSVSPVPSIPRRKRSNTITDFSIFQIEQPERPTTPQLELKEEQSLIPSFEQWCAIENAPPVFSKVKLPFTPIPLHPDHIAITELKASNCQKQSIFKSKFRGKVPESYPANFSPDF